jgi:hypothetical protein
MSTQTPSQKPEGKPTGENEKIDQDKRDQNRSQREGTTAGSGGKPMKETADEDERGGKYGQREGSTVSEDNDVE